MSAGSSPKSADGTSIVQGGVGKSPRCDVYLASTSPARAALLRQAGVGAVIYAPSVDEDALTKSQPPAELVLELARAKAEEVATRHAKDIDGLVFGGDSVFEFGGKIFGKPGSAEAATERLRIQRGKTGTLWSGHWLIDARRDATLTDSAAREGHPFIAVGGVASAQVTFAELSDDEITAYVASGEPLNVAGAFTIDSLGGPFISRVVGDPSTVVGLSLSTLRELVHELGLSWVNLWK